jgi:hypothetical protein
MDAGNAGGPRQKYMRAPAPSTLGHLPAWAGITIIVCLVLFLTDFWFAIVTGRLIMVGLGALALVIAGVCAIVFWPADVPERHDSRHDPQTQVPLKGPRSIAVRDRTPSHPAGGETRKRASNTAAERPGGSPINGAKHARVFGW